MGSSLAICWQVSPREAKGWSITYPKNEFINVTDATHMFLQLLLYFLWEQCWLGRDKSLLDFKQLIKLLAAVVADVRLQYTTNQG